MNSIIVAGYMGSGSSAATDLLREYANVECPNGSYEYVFLHCPDGLFDLEDKLLVGNNAIRSDEALRRFRKAMTNLFGNGRWWFAGYEERLSPAFLSCVDSFIGTIGCCAFEGDWYEHEKVDKAHWFMGRLAQKLGLSTKPFFRLYQDQMTVAFPSVTEFYGAAKTFVDATLKLPFSESFNKTALFDQLLLPHNLWRMGHYFSDETKAILVERDPRDVFVLNKYVWYPQGCPVPFPLNVEQFCRYYRNMRQAVFEFDRNRVLSIWFEDLVLHYDETVQAVEFFFGKALGEHERKKEFLNPDVSKRNVCIYRNDAKYTEEVSFIAEQLSNYLYPRSHETLLIDREGKPF